MESKRQGQSATSDNAQENLPELHGIKEAGAIRNFRQTARRFARIECINEAGAIRNFR